MAHTDHQSQDKLERLEEENRLLKEELASIRRFVRSLQHVMDSTDERVNDVDIMVILEQILIDAMEAIDASDGSLLVLDEDTSELVFVLAKGDIPQGKISGIRLPPGKGIAGWVAENREPTIVENPHADHRFYTGLDNSFQFHTKSIIAAPIIGGGRVLGVIEILNKELGNSFSADDLTLLMLMCRFAGELLHTLEELSLNSTNKLKSAGSD
ncbi:MAG: GAF domain-containing protein [Gammaproteobacteria bacterium]|nr:GAF domain-containing protein [Gammaproteobacteria bacterium]